MTSQTGATLLDSEYCCLPQQQNFNFRRRSKTYLMEIKKTHFRYVLIDVYFTNTWNL